MTTEKSCGAVLFRLDKDKSIKYLLLHYEAGHWDFPKGNQEKGETEKQTVQREIKEETGIDDVKFIDGFKDTVKYFYKKGGSIIYKEVVFYLAESVTEEVTLSSEHIGYSWMHYDHVFRRLTFKTSKELFGKADKFIREANSKR